MACPKKEKTKSDVDDAIFKFESKRDELLDYFGQSDDEEAPISRFNIGVIETTLIELANKWEILGSTYMSFICCREENED